MASARLQKAITDGTPFTFEARIIRPDGEVRHVVSVGQSECSSDRAVNAIFGVLQDVTARKDAGRERERLIERFNAATRAAQVGIWDWDVATDTIVWDPIMFALYGASEAPFAPTYAAWAAALHPDDRARAERELTKAAAGDGSFDTEFRLVWPDGDVHNIRAMATLTCDEGACTQRMIGTNWDITEVRALADQLRKEKDVATLAASHDALTGLLNRRGLESWVSSQTALEGTLLCLDIDGFKAVNDRGGHGSGDDTLRVVARIMREAIREADECARIGGDEFLVVLLNTTSMSTAARVSSRIACGVQSLRPLGADDDTRIGISIGIAALTGVNSFADALREADADLYRCKAELKA